MSRQRAACRKHGTSVGLDKERAEGWTGMARSLLPARGSVPACRHLFMIGAVAPSS